MTTIYKIADHQDFGRILSTFELTERLSHPTVFAEKDGEIIGFLSTHDNPRSVVAGPFVSKSQVVAVRLGQIYEAILKTLGIGVFWFHVERDNHRYLNLLKKIGYEMIEEDKTGFWFRRRLH